MDHSDRVFTIYDYYVAGNYSICKKYNGTHCLLLEAYIYTLYISGAVCVATLLTAAAAWLLIPKWRSYKNYIFTNITLALTANIALIYTILRIDYRRALLMELTSDVQTGVALSMYCWLLVLCLAVYADLVVIFRSQVTRQKLKSALFAWGVPALHTCIKLPIRALIHIYVGFENVYDSYYRSKKEIIDYAFSSLILLVNFGLFLRVVYSVVRGGSVPGSRRSVCQSVQVATLTFVASGTVMFTFIVIYLVIDVIFLSRQYNEDNEDLTSDPLFIAVIFIICNIQTVLVNVFFLVLRANRALLSQYVRDKASTVRCRQ